MLNEVDQNVDHIFYMFDSETTPVKACRDLAYRVSNNGMALLLVASDMLFVWWR